MSSLTKPMSAALTSLFVLACRFSETNPEHCANNDGDAYCAALEPDGSLPYCEAGKKGCITPGHEQFGCVAERPRDECYSPCGGPSAAAENGGCLAGSETSVSSTTIIDTESSGTDGESTTGSPCMGIEDCKDAAMPFCDPVTETCVACDGMEDPNGACTDLDPVTPLCAGGRCVQCTPENPVECEEERLVCDGSTGLCGPCTGHAQCTSGACELDVGSCFSDDFVVHVDGDGGADYTSIADAEADIPRNGHGVITVHALDGDAAYDPVIINDGKVIALLAAPGEAPSIRSPLAPSLRVAGEGATLYIDGLTLSGNPVGLGLRVDLGALAWVDRSRITQNVAGGILVDDARLVLRNSFVGGTHGTDVLRINAGTVDLLYSTLGAGTGLSTAISCEEAKHVAVRNSLIVSSDICPEIDCPGMIVTRSATEIDLQDPVILGFLEIVSMDNVALGDMSPEWFEGYTTGDFHLSGLQPAALDSVAAWSVSDPTIDIDGDARSIDGTLDYAGADVP